jgi:TonB family protein
MLTEELASARSEQRLDEVLTLASQRLEQNSFTVPANDNARYYYELALSNDPGNTVARQGLTIVASKLVLRAREAIDSGQLNDAERYLRDATALDSEGADLAASMQALNSAKEGQAAARAEAERQAALENAEGLAGSGDSAADAPGTDETGAASESLVAGSVETGDRSAGADLATTVDGVTLSANREARPDRAADSSAQTAAGDSASQSGLLEYVPISSLKRTNYVAPRYPRSAQRRNITGWVDVSFTVNRGGDVMDVGILDSAPGDVFNDAATEAVSQWRFEPLIEDGAPVAKMVAVRLMFSLE